jgi:type 1 glutamine amidotransferase
LIIKTRTKKQDIDEDLKNDVTTFETAQNNANQVPESTNKTKSTTASLTSQSSLSHQLKAFEEAKINSLQKHAIGSSPEWSPEEQYLERRDPVGKTTITQQIKSIQTPLNDLSTMNQRWRRREKGEIKNIV